MRCRLSFGLVRGALLETLALEVRTFYHEVGRPLQCYEAQSRYRERMLSFTQNPLGQG